MRELTRSNGLAPEYMTAAERMAELGEILALGAMRMFGKSSSLSGDGGDSSVDFARHQSGSASRTNGSDA
jgi:hypothetical protein